MTFRPITVKKHCPVAGIGLRHIDSIHVTSPVATDEPAKDVQFRPIIDSGFEWIVRTPLLRVADYWHQERREENRDCNFYDGSVHSKG